MHGRGKLLHLGYFNQSWTNIFCLPTARVNNARPDSHHHDLQHHHHHHLEQARHAVSHQLSMAVSDLITILIPTPWYVSSSLVDSILLCVSLTFVATFTSTLLVTMKTQSGALFPVSSTTYSVSQSRRFSTQPPTGSPWVF